ncbi:MAG: hypothetical protein FWH12_08320 [Treponema sp.]|nr:hypothetical protein [Treponema sp.]
MQDKFPLPWARLVLTAALFAAVTLGALGQTHVSVPLDHRVYGILDLAEARGLLAPLPRVRPYTRDRILSALDEILRADGGRWGALDATEREIIARMREEFRSPPGGLHLDRGLYRHEGPGRGGLPFAGELGIGLDSFNSLAHRTDHEGLHFGTGTWGFLYLQGDLGEQVSFNVDFGVGLMRAPRAYLGELDTFGPEAASNYQRGHVNRTLDVHSQALAFFPYSYQKEWDGFMFNLGEITASNMGFWPQSLAIAPRMHSELTAAVLGDSLVLRFGRIRREWGGMAPGSSLVFNGSARPFVGIEASYNPIYWFAYSAITGILEYEPVTSIYDDPRTSQNAFSLQMVEINIKQYAHISFGSTAIWPRRFDLGYVFPLVDNFFYQNFTGKFDNMGVFANLKLRYPGLGGLWFSVFVDEMEISSLGQAFELDRHMFAYQAGLQGNIPALPLAEFIFSYTKVEPYTYTHHRDTVPWYGGLFMEKSYTNNGSPLGYYLPPNSDEIKLRLQMRPAARAQVHLQYQLIRRGVEYGPQQVDGSSFWSELDPEGRSEKVSLRKNFLSDGAYERTQVIKAGGEYRFEALPLRVYGELGLVLRSFSTIGEEEYLRYAPPSTDGRRPREDLRGVYEGGRALIFTLGFSVFR